MAVPTYATKLEVYAGDSWAQTFTFKVGGVAENLTAWTSWECHWRTSATAATFIALTVDSSAKATGVINISATPAQTRAMGKDGEWDVQALNGSAVRTFITGKTKWRRDVTHD